LCSDVRTLCGCSVFTACAGANVVSANQMAVETKERRITGPGEFVGACVGHFQVGRMAFPPLNPFLLPFPHPPRWD